MLSTLIAFALSSSTVAAAPAAQASPAMAAPAATNAPPPPVAGAGPSTSEAPAARTPAPRSAAATRALAKAHALELEWARAGQRQARTSTGKPDTARLETVAKAFREALTAAPGWAEAHEGLGRTLFRLGRGGEARAALEAAVAADASRASAWLALGYVARSGADAERASQAYARYVALMPSDPDGHFALAEASREAGQWAGATRAYRDYVELEQRPSEQAFLERSRANLAAIEQIQALEAALRPGTFEPQTAGAEEHLSHPPLGKNLVSRGDALMRRREYREAAFSFQDAVHAEPSSAEALFKLGNTYAVLGYYRQALQRWQRAGELSSDPAVRKSVADNLERAREKLRDEGGSPQAAGHPVGSGPVTAEARGAAHRAYEEAVKEIGAGRYEASVRLLTESIRFEPGLAVAFVARGSARVGLRDYQEAALDYQHALRLAPGLSAPLYGIAESYRALGRDHEAREFYLRYADSRAPDARADLQSEARTKAGRL